MASLVATFIIGAVVLSVSLGVILAKKAPSSPYPLHVAQMRTPELTKHRRNSGVARMTAKDKSTSVVADAGRSPAVAGKNVEGP